MKSDIKNREDILLLVKKFYEKGSKDEVIGPIFLNTISEDTWEDHMQIITDFWTSVLFLTNEYKGNAFPKHRVLNLESIHFERWLALFTNIVDDLFVGIKAKEIKEKAEKMSIMFQSKIQFLKDNPTLKPLI